MGSIYTLLQRFRLFFLENEGRNDLVLDKIVEFWCTTTRIFRHYEEIVNLSTAFDCH
jgi:hypothetical protein